MIMVYIAVSLCSAPILVMLFYAVYKTVLLIQVKNEKPIELVLVPETVVSVENKVIAIDTDDDEIVAVITAAVMKIRG
jgi:hypothetical protein